MAGFIASTDDHEGYPGFYGRGLCAIIADTLTRAPLWEAIQQRRTYALTGDRIDVSFRINGQPMGSVLASGQRGPRRIAISVDGWDCLEGLELLKNNCLVRSWNDFPPAKMMTGRFKVSLE